MVGHPETIQQDFKISASERSRKWLRPLTIKNQFSFCRNRSHHAAPSAKPVELVSNDVTLEILPADPTWQSAELERIRTVLRQHPPAPPFRRDDDARTMGLKSLRYLGTPDAAREMAKLFGANDGNTESECMFGLVGSPSCADGLKEMKRLVAMPTFPVDEHFLSTMALLSLDPNTPPGNLPKQREENLHQVSEELLRFLPVKTGVALAISADAALSSKQDQL